MARYSRKKKNKKKRERRKAIYVLPNLFTSASLFSGFYGIIAAMEGYFATASLAILISLLCDGLDGKVARATGTTTRFGVEYDSLADLVAFGVAPGLLAFLWALQPVGRLGWLAAFLYVACGALRLARFNVQVEEVGTKHFVGLPIPAAACMLATTVLFVERIGLTGDVVYWPMVVLTFALSFLMVSNIHYLSFKEAGLAKLKSFNWLVTALLCFTLVAIEPKVMGFAIMFSYVALGPLGARIMARKRAEKEAAKAKAEMTTTEMTGA